jgi:hypothetical protein
MLSKRVNEMGSGVILFSDDFIRDYPAVFERVVSMFTENRAIVDDGDRDIVSVSGDSPLFDGPDLVEYGVVYDKNIDAISIVPQDDSYSSILVSLDGSAILTV